MKNFLERYVVVFFSVIIFGGLLWGITGAGLLFGQNWNIVHLLLSRVPLAEGLVYLFIGLCTACKTIFNILYDRPDYPPHIMVAIFSVVLAGFHWGIIGFGLLIGRNFNLTELFFNGNGIIRGIIHFTVGILALFKLSNFVFEKKES